MYINVYTLNTEQIHQNIIIHSDLKQSFTPLARHVQEIKRLHNYFKYLSFYRRKEPCETISLIKYKSDVPT